MLGFNKGACWILENLARPVALVTGGSRGVGAAAVTALAGRGYDVAFLYRNKAARAAQVASTVQRAGSAALSLACDITNGDDRERMTTELVAWRPGLDVLVLNASGGLERDLLAVNPDYPLLINRYAQVALVDRLLPVLAPGSTVVFVTSHWPHLYGQVVQIPAYEPIAASKYAGEHALRALLPQLATRRSRLLVITDDLVEGIITPKLLERTAQALRTGGARNRAAYRARRTLVMLLRMRCATICCLPDRW
jgi:NAD(P)-dependent dehydrogenase (short-subunit alcohol dehydrogenase family)